jgi:hypothetical protein
VDPMDVVHVRRSRVKLYHSKGFRVCYRAFTYTAARGRHACTLFRSANVVLCPFLFSPIHDAYSVQLILVMVTLISEKEKKNNTGCFKKSFTAMKAYIKVFRGHAQCFELLQCGKAHLG